MKRPPIAGSTVLVTGGAGFIGSHLVDQLLARGAEQVVVVDNLFVGTPENLEAALATGKAVLYRDDAELASSLAYMFDRHSIDLVFNCATKALNYSFVNPSNAFATNVTTTLNLLEHQRRGAFSTLCHFSSSEVYGSAVYEPMDEDHPKLPTTTYAAGKAAADLAVHSYVSMFDLDAFIVRPFNNFGPRQNWRGPLASVLTMTVARLLAGEPPEIHGDGTQSRDFIYVFDTVDAVLELHAVMDRGDVVNLSTGNHISIADLVAMICKEFDYTGEIVRRPARAADVLTHNASNEKARSLVELQLTPFPEALSRTIDWYRKAIVSAERS